MCEIVYNKRWLKSVIVYVAATIFRTALTLLVSYIIFGELRLQVRALLLHQDPPVGPGLREDH